MPIVKLVDTLEIPHSRLGGTEEWKVLRGQTVVVGQPLNRQQLAERFDIEPVECDGEYFWPVMKLMHGGVITITSANAPPPSEWWVCQHQIEAD